MDSVLEELRDILASTGREKENANNTGLTKTATTFILG
jgi:hypothetical protein